MPTERMEEVEVVGCEAYQEDHEGRSRLCTECGREEPDHETPYIATMPVAPNSLTAARLRLADAAERMDKASKASTECHTVFGTEEECAAFYAKVGYTEAEALAVEQECYAACAEYNAALAALRTARGA